VPGLVEKGGVSTHRLIQGKKTPFPEAPTQAPGKDKAKGELKDNQKQKYQPIGQNFKQTLRINATLKGKTCHAVSITVNSG